MDHELSVIVLEPKYCELCGSLWLRAASSTSPYCVRCIPEIAALAPIRLRSDQCPESIGREP
jgi:ferredoxin